MNRRKFVVMSTVLMLALTVAITGLAYYSNFAAKAFQQTLPAAISYLPANTQAVFGINVQKLVNSPIYAQAMAKHGAEIAANLAEFTTKTGVNPSTDIDYIIGAGRPAQQKGAGVIIAVGSFKQNLIIDFINSHGTPIRLFYNDAVVLMIPETNASGAKLEKGVAFLNDNNIALGDLESLKAVLDVYKHPSATNATLPAMVANLDPREMFWFAGDATVLSKLPQNTPLTPSLSAIQSVFGILDLESADKGVTITINGNVTVTAKDATAATQLGDFVRGLVALGNLMGGQNPDLAALIGVVKVERPKDNQLKITLNIPFDFMQKLEAAKGKFGVDVPLRIK